MYAQHLRCISCNNVYPLKQMYTCPDCYGALEVIFDYDKLIADNAVAHLFQEVKPSISQYSPLLPLEDPEKMISLGEGGTNLIPLQRISGFVHINVFLKNETTNPTGSFKDRPIAVAVSRAQEEAIKTIVIASSGNAATSAAAYSARGGFGCIVVIPSTTPMMKVSQAQAYGAFVVRVNGSYSDCYKLAEEVAEKYGYANVTTTYLNPYNLEGDKTISYELFTQLGYQVPDWIIVPVGAGPLVTGIYKGFQELRYLGFTNQMPRMVAVQSKKCAPIVTSYEKGEKSVDAWTGPINTVASALADPLRGYSRDGSYTLNTILSSSGRAIAVDDIDILNAVASLASNEGLFVEPSAATPLAALHYLSKEGHVKVGDTVVLMLTGHGLKDSQSLHGRLPDPEIIEPKTHHLISLFEASQIRR